jgi:hypothetical protein
MRFFRASALMRSVCLGRCALQCFVHSSSRILLSACDAMVFDFAIHFDLLDVSVEPFAKHFAALVAFDIHVMFLSVVLR